MANVYVERTGSGTYRAIQLKQEIVTGATQKETADAAHLLRPNDPVFVERVRFTEGGSPDKWRRVY
jgi:hypothetical protein